MRILVFTILLAAGLPVLAQEKSLVPISPANNDRNFVLVEPKEDYRLGPGDVVEVLIEDAPELSRVFRVSAQGEISFPNLGKVKAVAQTTEELSAAIAKTLKEQDYLKMPQVTVSLRQYNSQNFFIQGAVKTPGVYQVEGHPSLLKLISLAGGLNENHGSTALILKEISKSKTEAVATPVAQTNEVENAEYDITSVKVSSLYQGGANNLRVTPGTIVYVPVADMIYVTGFVIKPGPVVLNTPITLSQAIGMVGGYTPEAMKRKVRLIRVPNGSESRVEQIVNMEDIEKHRIQDIALQANDLIDVPNSTGKSIMNGIIRTAIPGVLTTLPYGVLSILK